MLIFPIASALVALCLLGSVPAVNADVLQRLQCWCRKRASHRDAHNDASYLQVVYYNHRFKYPVLVEHECTHGYCVGIVGERESLFHFMSYRNSSPFSFLFILPFLSTIPPQTEYFFSKPRP